MNILLSQCVDLRAVKVKVPSMNFIIPGKLNLYGIEITPVREGSFA